MAGKPPPAKEEPSRVVTDLAIAARDAAQMARESCSSTESAGNLQGGMHYCSLGLFVRCPALSSLCFAELPSAFKEVHCT